MKPLYVIICALIIVFEPLFVKYSHAQIPQTVIRPILGQYVNSATPSVTTGIQYRLDAVNSDGTPTTYQYQNCKFVWSITNGKDAIDNTSTKTVSGTSKDIFVKWDNVNDFGRLKVTTYNLYSPPSSQAEACPLGNNQVREIIVPIQYFADLDAIRLNGSPISTANLNCGTNSITLSIPTPYTTNPSNAQIDYIWDVTGGQITSGQYTNTIQVTPFLNEDMTAKVRAERHDNPYIPKSKTANLVRPNPKNISVNNITNICPSQTITATATATNASGYEWTSSGGVFVNGTQNTGITGSSIGVTGNSTGSYSVRAYSSSCQTYSNKISYNVFYGLAQVYNFTVNYQSYNPSTNGYVCTGNNQSIQADVTPGTTGYNWSITSGNAYDAYLSAYGNQASFTPNGSGYYNIALNLTNVCGTSTNSLSFNAYSCFSRYTVYPNPAKDYVSIEFDKIENKESLPEQIDLLNEGSTKPLLSVDVQDYYLSKSLKNGKTLDLNVKNFPRGIYYLHIKNSKNKDKPVDSIRVIFE